jgi:hypothetical protein
LFFFHWIYVENGKIAIDGVWWAECCSLYTAVHVSSTRYIYNVYTIVDIYRDAYWCGPQRATTVPSQRGAKPSP